MSTDEAVVGAFPRCQLCATAGVVRDATHDAKLVAGPWAFVCAQHFDRYGVGLGTGRGQRLVLSV